MNRKVYFSFHYADVSNFRVNVVRKSNTFKKSGISFTDSSIWEESQRNDIRGIKQMINSELLQTSVTCVLIGIKTYERKFVRYELAKSFEMRKGLLAVGINWIRDKNKQVDILPGKNPLNYLGFKISMDRKWIFLFELIEEKWQPYKDLPRINYSHKYLDKLQAETIYKLTLISKRYSYDWNDGYNNLPKWIENAAQSVGR